MITILKASIEEATIIVDIGKKSLVESHGSSAPTSDIEFYISNTYNLDKIKAELSNKENVYHIIYYKGQAAGYSKIIFDSVHPNINTGNVTKLDRLYLLKEFYDLKLGLKLFEFNKELSKKSNQAGMWLYTWVGNQRAINFYKKLGFEIIGKADFKISEHHSNPNYQMYLKY